MGMAKKANKIVLGYDKSLESIHRKSAFVVYCTNDLSPKTLKGLHYASEETGVKVVTTDFSMFDFANAVGSKVGVVAVLEKGFATKLNTLL